MGAQAILEKPRKSSAAFIPTRSFNMVTKVEITFWVSDAIPDGKVCIDVHEDWAPIGAKRFLDLVDQGYYNQVRVARVIDGFMAQFGISGDPNTYDSIGNKQVNDDPVKQ